MISRSHMLIFLVLLFQAGSVVAQRVDAEALLSDNHIKIGEQVQLKLAVRYREGSAKSVVTWPELKDTITSKIEIVKSDSIITRLADRVSVLYEQARTITITAFDSGTYMIPAQKFIVDHDTVFTDSIAFYVSSIPVDTTKPIKDIKGIYDVPDAPVIVEASSSHWLAWTLAGVGIIAFGILLFFLLKKKEEAPVASQVFTRSILPHEKYLEQLAELGRKKPWLNGDLKQYHIALTEILRSWIIERYRIHAKEMTTVEILRALYALKADASAVMQLERALRLADLVKFAKGIPAEDENENSLQLAINFVNATAFNNQPLTPFQQ